MDFGRVTGWFFLNIGVPLLAPIALLFLLGSMKKYRRRRTEIVRGSIAEGQLFWTIIAMCAAAVYEAAVYLGQLQAAGADGWKTTVTWTLLGFHGLILVASALLVAFATIEADDAKEQKPQQQEPSDAAEGQPPAPMSSLVKSSIRLALGIAVTFTVTHLWAS